jgi:hypothetical protein
MLTDTNRIIQDKKIPLKRRDFLFLLFGRAREVRTSLAVALSTASPRLRASACGLFVANAKHSLSPLKIKMMEAIAHAAWIFSDYFRFIKSVIVN